MLTPQSPSASLAPPPARAGCSSIVDLGFVAARAKLLEVAAFLDRVERYGEADDVRCVALRDAAQATSNRTATW